VRSIRAENPALSARGALKALRIDKPSFHEGENRLCEADFEGETGAANYPIQNIYFAKNEKEEGGGRKGPVFLPTWEDYSPLIHPFCFMRERQTRLCLCTGTVLSSPTVQASRIKADPYVDTAPAFTVRLLPSLEEIYRRRTVHSLISAWQRRFSLILFRSRRLERGW
jgi:hypothetical protein